MKLLIIASESDYTLTSEFYKKELIDEFLPQRRPLTTSTFQSRYSTPFGSLKRMKLTQSGDMV